MSIIAGDNAGEVRVLDTESDPNAAGSGTDNDPDLESPFDNVDDADLDPDTSFGNALIIQGDGLSDPVPDDDQNGGVMSFLFDNALTIGFVDMLDIEEETTISLFSDQAGGVAKLLIDLSGSVDLKGAPDTVNQWIRFGFNQSGVRRMDIDFGGSGAVGAIGVVPVPFSLPLLASAFGIAALVRRRSLRAA